MLIAFKIFQFLVMILCFLGSIGDKDGSLNETCRDLFKASGTLFLLSEVIPQILEIIN